MFFFLGLRRLRAPRVLVTILLASAAFPLYAADDSAALSLATATEIAAARAPQIQAQLLRVQAAKSDAVRAGRLPDPELTAGINNLTATGAQAFDAAADSMTMRSIGLTQVFPSHAKLRAEKAVANADVQLTSANVVTVRLAVQRATASAWVALWAAHRERQLLEELREQSALAVTIAKARLAGGTGSATDVLAARSAEVALNNRVIGVEADIAAARASLQRWIGEPVGETLASAPDFATLPVPPSELQQNLDQQGPLLGWAAREGEAQAKLDLAKAGKDPNWSVGLVYGNRIGRPDMLGIEVGLSLPIFPGNRQDRDISARTSELEAVQNEHDEALRAERAAVVAGLAKWQGDTQQVTAFREQLLPLAEDRSRTALAEYRGGGSLEPWLEARRDGISTRVAYAQALAAWGTAWAALAYLIPDQYAPLVGGLQEPQP